MYVDIFGSNKCIAVARVGSSLTWNNKWCDDNSKIICEFDGQGLSPTGNNDKTSIEPVA